MAEKIEEKTAPVSRTIDIAGDADGTVVISGDGNIVSIGRAPEFSQGQAPKTKISIPDLLPYMSDREDQQEVIEDELNKHLENLQQRPFAFILSWDNQDRLDMMRKCVVENILPHCPKSGAKQFGVIGKSGKQLPWPTMYSAEMDLKTVFLQCLSKTLLPHKLGQKADLEAFLSAEKKTNFLFASYQSSYWLKGEGTVLDAFLRFWDNWPDSVPVKPLIICLTITYNTPDNAWDRFRQRKTHSEIEMWLETAQKNKQQRYQNIGLHILPKLGLVSVTDTVKWAGSDEVREFVEDNLPVSLEKLDLENEVRQLHKKIGDPVPMRLLGKALERLLEGFIDKYRQ